MRCCKEHLKGIPRELKDKVLRKIRSLHMPKNAMEFHMRLEDFCTFLTSNGLCVHALLFGDLGEWEPQALANI